MLNLWARFLYEPLTEDRVRRIQETDDPQFGREVAEKVHAGLKRTGGVKPPREFVLMDRSAIGLGGVFVRLKAELNWFRLFSGLVEGFDEAALAERQARGAGGGGGAGGGVGGAISTPRSNRSRSATAARPGTRADSRRTARSRHAGCDRPRPRHAA